MGLDDDDLGHCYNDAFQCGRGDGWLCIGLVLRPESWTTVNEQEWVADEFERCRPWIEKALARQPLPSHTIEHVRDEVLSGHAMLWPTPNAAAVIEVIQYPTGIKTLNHWLAGGSLKELKATEKAVAEFGRKNGFAAVTISGREGWARTLRGYRRATTYLVKDLT